jgi:hypothetical protein
VRRCHLGDNKPEFYCFFIPPSINCWPFEKSGR